MSDQLSFFPEPEQAEQFDVDAAAAHIGRVASTPEHKLSVERAYNRDADRLGLLDDEPTADTTPHRGTFEAPEDWRLTAEEKASGPAGIAAVREVLGDRK